MYCFRCGTKVDKNQTYCPHCGANIKEEMSRYYTPEYMKEAPSHEDQYQYSIQYSYKDNDDYLKAYIGKNYDKIIKQKFSIPTFIFGPLYFLYRKMYIYAPVYLLLLILLGPITTLIISFFFNKIYIYHANKKIKEIKQKYNTESEEQILEHCKKSGGRNIIIPILIGIILIIFIIYNIKPKENRKTNRKNYLKEITYTIPKGYNINYETDNYKSYVYDDTNKYCTIQLSAYTYTSIYKNEEDYINSILQYYTTTNSPIDNITINNKNWKHINIITDYNNKNYYVLKQKNNYYEISTSDTKEQGCKKDFNTFINSINYKE